MTTNELRERALQEDVPYDQAMILAILYVGDAIRECDGHDVAEAIKTVALEIGSLPR